MRSIIQSFSIGLLTATLIIGYIYWQVDATSNEELAGSEITITDDDVTQHLEEQGLIAVKNDDYENLIREKQQLETKLDELNNETDQSGDSKVLNIESGMTLGDIASELDRLNIIDDVQSFSQYMEEQGYSREIQLGEYEINTDMSYEEIASLITR
ncbi:endolytic transglycosylase MltG [Piscibacillus halophilus]|uniref:YceG-like family protein n=1 Tax=Piscibacillus halophilus TaxID=571933 RepID=A0A1H9MC81_9BACI|nr:endolytic transglycosylase MltG [Piscibacillus halophilus]SER21232.1 YceG-like family protein [Piscibacillus halophilus]